MSLTHATAEKPREHRRFYHRPRIQYGVTLLYCQIDDALSDAPQHPQAVLSISELVTIGVLYAIKNSLPRSRVPTLSLRGA